MFAMESTPLSILLRLLLALGLHLAVPGLVGVIIGTDWRKYDSAVLITLVCSSALYSVVTIVQEPASAISNMNATECTAANEASAVSKRAIKEREIAIRLLHTMVPPKVAQDLASGREVLPQMHDFVVIFFSDIKGFTAFAAINSSLEVFAMLERTFSVMDFCVSLFPSLYKVETAGDSYMVVGGLLDFDEGAEDEEENDLRALSPNLGSASDTRNCIVANAMCQFALLVRDSVQKVNMDESSFVQIRIGIHCGPVTTGISGRLTPKFCIFGDAVNCAARMEQTGRTAKVHISGALRSFMLHSPLPSKNYHYEKREPIEVKGKGTMQTYFLENSRLDRFISKYAAEIEKIDSLVAMNHVGKFVQKGRKVVRNDSTERLFESGRRYAMWEDILHEELAASQLKAREEVEAEVDVEMLLIHPHQEGQRETAFPRNQEGNSSVGTSVASPVVTFEEMLSDDFSVLSIDIDDFSACHVVIMELIRGVIGGSFEEIDVDENTLHRFVRRIGTTYRECPYHNFWHAFCVTREAALLIHCLELEEAGFTKPELFTIMISALVHDVDHPGTNNDYEVKSMSRLALLYNDNSVLENHHLALTFNILQLPNYDIFGLWWDEERRNARRVITNAVLSTDMAIHKVLQLDLQARAGRSPPYNIAHSDDRMELVKIILHTADIFNVTRKSAISSEIAAFVQTEFSAQTTKEINRGLPVTPWMVTSGYLDVCKNELGFINFVARPYFAALADCFPSNKKVNFLPEIDANVDYWKLEIRRLEAEAAAAAAVGPLTRR